jgi:glycosyltransferase involved in cell wall biosynthesis
MNSKSISLCMIVKNEEQNLERCLKSAAGVVDEIVIVDTGSTDHTLQIARPFGAKILESPWQGDFALHRNQSVEAASGDWILWMDADEELAADSGKIVREAANQSGAQGLRLVVRNLQPEGELCRYLDLHITRMFRKNVNHRFEGRIHEQITPSILRHGGQVEDIDAIILHHGYASKTAQGNQVRYARNIALIEEALSETPDDAYLLYQAGAAYKSAGDLARAQQRLQKAAQQKQNADLGSEVRTDLFMKLAQIALSKDDYADAAKYARISLEAAPRNVIARYVLALALLFNGKYGAAYQEFLRVKKWGADALGNPQELETVLAYCRQRMDSKK